MVPLEQLERIEARFAYLEARLAEGATAEEIADLSREYADLRPVVEDIAAYRAARASLGQAEEMLSDPEMAPLAREEIAAITSALPDLERAVELALLPKDAADSRPAILEIRPGTGGDEAALFAGDLARMYARYAEARGWSFEVIESAETEGGCSKRASNSNSTSASSDESCRVIDSPGMGFSRDGLLVAA